MSSIVTFCCPFCHVNKFLISKYLTHIQFCHESEADFIITCGLDGCPCTYKTVKCLRQHMRHKHSSIYYATNANESLDSTFNSSLNASLTHSDIAPSSDFEPEVECSSSETEPVNKDFVLNDFLLEMQKHFALFVLGLGEKHSIPTIVQQEIADEVRCFFTYFSSNYSEFLRQYFSKAGLVLDPDDDLKNLLENDTFFDRTFSIVSSEAKILTYCKANLGFIAPVEIDIDDDTYSAEIDDNNSENNCDDNDSVGNTRTNTIRDLTDVDQVTSAQCSSQHKNVKETFQYVPILDVIKKFVQQPEVWNSIQRFNETNDANSDLLCSYADGNICHQHDVFGNNKHALRIHLYTDEFEVCNPIGSHRSTHKLCAFYFFIGNLEEKYHSKLKYIHLSILVKEKFIKRSNTFAQVLKPLISDLKKLFYDGIKVVIEGVEVRLYGALATISADNLSAHALAGFRRAFNSGRFCRYCMLQYENKEKLLQESSLVLRTETMHTYHLQGVTAGISASTYGVDKRCPFLDLPYFRLIESFPPDLMHDLLEGIVPLTLKLVLAALHREGIVTLAQVNSEISNFEFGKNDSKNKPVNVPLAVSSGSGNISGSASEKLCLFLLLPFLIGDRVPVDNNQWNLYLLLRDIMDYLMCHKIPRRVLPYLQLLVENFVQTFVELFPGKMTPKLHFLLHYPRLIREYGPLRFVWCMRFESKHQYFKQLAGVVRNFRNIAFTLAKRHQLRQCWEFAASNNFMKDSVECSGECSIYFGNLPECQRRKLLNYVGLTNARQSEILWKCNMLSRDSVTFKLHDVILVGLLHCENIPLFFKIFYIYKFRDDWFFIGKLLICESYSSHLHAYSVTEDSELTVCQPSQIIDHQLLDTYLLADGKTYVSLKYMCF